MGKAATLSAGARIEFADSPHFVEILEIDLLRKKVKVFAGGDDRVRFSLGLCSDKSNPHDRSRGHVAHSETT